MSRVQRKDTATVQKQALEARVRELERLMRNLVMDDHDPRLIAIESSVLSSEISAFENRTLTAFGDLLTIGPSLTLPAGTWVLSWGAYMRNATAGTSAIMGLEIAGVVPTDPESAQVDSGVASNGVSVSMSVTKTVTGGTLVRNKYRASAGTASFGRRWLTARRKIA